MPAIFRNYLVFANNKRQNIESRLFATGSGFRTGSVAIAYSSFYNKFVSDRPTLFNTVSPKYYASESIASSTSTNIVYQNNRSIYLQNFDIFVQETVSNTLQNETSSLNTSLNTKYFLVESNGAGDSIIYQNNKAVYLQNLDIFITEAPPPITRLNETGSSTTILNTKYT